MATQIKLFKNTSLLILFVLSLYFFSSNVVFADITPPEINFTCGTTSCVQSTNVEITGYLYPGCTYGNSFDYSPVITTPDGSSFCANNTTCGENLGNYVRQGYTKTVEVTHHYWAICTDPNYPYSYDFSNTYVYRSCGGYDIATTCASGQNCQTIDNTPQCVESCTPGQTQLCSQTFGTGPNTCIVSGTQTCSVYGIWNACPVTDPRTAACLNKQCGDDTCGGTCGTCPSGQSCSNGQCFECIHDEDCTYHKKTCDGTTILVTHTRSCQNGMCVYIDSGESCDTSANEYKCGVECETQGVIQGELCPTGWHSIVLSKNTCVPSNPLSDDSCDWGKKIDCGQTPIYGGKGCLQGDKVIETNTTNQCQTFGTGANGNTVPQSPGSSYDCVTKNTVGVVDMCATKGGVVDRACEGSKIVTKNAFFVCASGGNDANGKPTASCVPGGINSTSIDCGPASSTEANYCSGGVKCTLTVDNPGMCESTCTQYGLKDVCTGYNNDGFCIEWEQQTSCLSSTNTRCSAPSINIVCNGPCNGSGGPDNQCVPESQQSCTGGTQTCNSSNQWGPCVPTPCVPGSSKGCTGGTQTCNAGGLWDPCVPTPPPPPTNPCTPGDKQSCTGGTQTCDANGQWGSCVPTPCVPGSSKGCIGGTQTCNADGTWGSCVPTPCVPGSSKACTGGTQTCDFNNQWGSCVPTPPPPTPPTTNPQCNNNKQCVPGGGGSSCVLNSDCANQTTCSLDRTCVINGGGGVCSGYSDCQSQPLQCNSNKQCLPGGGGGDCLTNSDCLSQATKCSVFKTCVPGGTGGICSTDGDCLTQLTQCNADKQCVPGGGGGSCNSYLDCLSQPTQCNGSNQCVPGGGGAACAIDSECGNNLPPYAENLQALASNYCSELVSFKWNYRDVENDTEKMYRFQVSANNSFNDAGLVVDKIVQTSALPNGSQNIQTLQVAAASAMPTSSCKPNCNYINYGVPYYWRVMVWENVTGKNSDFINYIDSDNSDDNDGNPNTYTYVWEHPAPIVVYAPLSYDLVRTFPAPGDTVYFADTSTCFNVTGLPYACKTLTTDKCIDAKCYTWNFSDNNLENGTNIETIGDVTHRYGAANPAGYMSSLKVCDDLGCCTAYENIPVKNKSAQELPQWKEISPF